MEYHANTLDEKSQAVPAGLRADIELAQTFLQTAITSQAISAIEKARAVWSSVGQLLQGSGSSRKEIHERADALEAAIHSLSE
jgi:hypothetical protein